MDVMDERDFARFADHYKAHQLHVSISSWWRHQMETRYWSFVRGIDRSPVNSPHKGQWRRALICVWINGWVNNREAGDLRRHRAHYDVTVMMGYIFVRAPVWRTLMWETKPNPNVTPWALVIQWRVASWRTGMKWRCFGTTHSTINYEWHQRNTQCYFQRSHWTPRLTAKRRHRWAPYLIFASNIPGVYSFCQKDSDSHGNVDDMHPVQHHALHNQ